MYVCCFVYEKRKDASYGQKEKHHALWERNEKP